MLIVRTLSDAINELYKLLWKVSPANPAVWSPFLIGHNNTHFFRHIITPKFHDSCFKKSRTLETLNLLTCSDRSTNNKSNCNNQVSHVRCHVSHVTNTNIHSHRLPVVRPWKFHCASMQMPLCVHANSVVRPCKLCCASMLIYCASLKMSGKDPPKKIRPAILEHFWAKISKAETNVFS